MQLALDRAGGAGSSAGTAVDAGISVDDIVLVTLGDSGHGAGALAGTAAHAVITDNIGHWKHLQFKCDFIVPQVFQIAMLNCAEGGYISLWAEKI